MSSIVTVSNKTLKAKTNINKPLFQCYDAGFQANDGNVYTATTGTVKEGTLLSISSSTYLSGSHEYEGTIQAPAGYRNVGQSIVCSGSFVDATYGTPQNNPIYISVHSNNSHYGYCNDIGGTYSYYNYQHYNGPISPGLQKSGGVSNIQVGDVIVLQNNYTAYGNGYTFHILGGATCRATAVYPDTNYNVPGKIYTTLTITSVEHC